MNILALIPARSGSKSVKDKNIREFCGKPLIAHSIEHALRSRRINRVIVSTDSEAYAEIAKAYGADVPFIRPAEYASDTSLDVEVFQHALQFLKKTEGYQADIIVHLRPTYPIRNITDIDNMIDQLIENPDFDSIRSISEASEIPYKMWYFDKKRICPVVKDICEPYNMPRQELPQAYYQNACIDVVRSSTILENNSMSGKNILGYVMNNNFDIDTEEEFTRAESYMRLQEGGKTFVFDIDGVIATFQKDLDYAKSSPNQIVIDKINKLYDAGNKIVLFTARGYLTGVDWTLTTKTQMESWGVKYHELHFGKPNADYYIDDKMLSLNDLIEFVEE